MLLTWLELLVPLLGPFLLAAALWPLAGSGRRRARLLAVQLLGAWGLALPFLAGASGHLAAWGPDPLRSYPLHAALLALGASLFWSLPVLLLGGLPPGRRGLAAGIQFGGLGLFAVALALASDWSLVTGFRWIAPASLDPSVRWYCLEGGSLVEGPGSGPARVLASGIPADPTGRIHAVRSERGWTLGVLGRAGFRPLVEDALPPAMRFALPLESPFRPEAPKGSTAKLGATPGPVDREGAFGPIPSLDPDPLWNVRLGRWAREGLRAESRDLGGGLDLALDTPFWSPAPRCGTLLPGGRVIVEIGGCLYLLDLGRREIACLGRGQGPLVGAY